MANPHLETIAVHAGERDKRRQHRSVTTPIELTSAYYFENCQQIDDFYTGRLPGVKYGRYGCPTQHAAEEKIAALDSGERALLFSSGMSAITSTLMALVHQGDHVVYVDECYRNTRYFLHDILPQFGIASTAMPVDGHLEDYILPNTRLCFSEAPTNPFLRVIDLVPWLEQAGNNGLVSVIDSTFASPINLRPLELGADLVIHSATKYLGGHHDLFAGVIIGKGEAIDQIQRYRDVTGGNIDPMSAFLLLRSLQTLAVRLQTHNRQGLAIAKWLDRQPEVERVWYPGLPSHSDYNTAKQYLTGYGGVITFALNANEKGVRRFIDALQLPYIATNFCGPQSLIEPHRLLTFSNDPSDADAHGITNNIIRYSSGFESLVDIRRDFKQAFNMLA